MRIGIATDHGGFSLKEELLAQLRAAGHEVVDFGAHSLNEYDDYPDYVVPLAQAVAALKVERGVAVCGSGVGASVCANKVRGIRAALIHDHFSAKQGVRSRVVSMPSWDIFEHQTQEYQDNVLPPHVTARVAVEQASTFGWERYVGRSGRIIGMKTFGASAPLKELQKKFGFEPNQVVAAAKRLLGRR